MLKERLEFELEYDPDRKQLTLIDYGMRGLERPFKMLYGNITEPEQIGITVSAWVELKNAQIAT